MDTINKILFLKRTTKRFTAVLRLYKEGKSSKEISDLLDISLNKIKEFLKKQK